MAERILLVEDTPALREMLHDFFTELGYECDAIGDGNTACVLLEEREYDVILTDVIMPGCDGFAVIEKANALYADSPKIVMTAFAGIEDVIHAMKLGAYDFVRKPIPSLDELRLLVERAMAYRKLLKERREHLRQIEDMNAKLRHFNNALESEVAAQTYELSEANRQLKSLDQMKNNLLANISHELRTPLVSVRGYIELLQHGQLGELPPAAAKYLGTCLRNVDRQLALIDDLIGYADTTKQDVDLHIETVDLCECFHGVIEKFANDGEQTGVTFQERFALPEILVNADRQRLEQALTMLLDNALKFNPAGTVVSVRLEPTTGNQLVIISVTDNGVGIPDEHLPHIFDRFYQCDTGERTRCGMGMGLTVARDNLRLMGCELRVSSTVGKSTIFHWNMPMRLNPE